MGKRRKARELAMQALFYLDVSKEHKQLNYKIFCKNFKPSKNIFDFFEGLVNGVLVNQTTIDNIIEKYASNWKIYRMSCVDRNTIRMAVYEMLFLNEIPNKVSINEAIDIGKKFGTEETGSFINGILDSIRIAIDEGKITPAAIQSKSKS